MPITTADVERVASAILCVGRDTGVLERDGKVNGGEGGDLGFRTAAGQITFMHER